MAEGVTADYDFNFIAELNEVDGTEFTSGTDGYAAVEEIKKTIGYTGEETIDCDNNKAGIQYNKTVNILDMPKGTFPHAGVYDYTVTEEEISNTDSGVYGITCSKAVYNMSVYVKEGTTGTYVSDVTVTRKVNDDGSPEDGGKKVDPSDPGENLGDSDRAKFTFGNTLTKRGGSEGTNNPDKEEIKPVETDPEYPDYVERTASLVISKTVAGDYGDTSKAFNFTITLYNSPLSNNESYVGKIYTKGISNSIVSGETVNVGVGYEFSLKHNQILVFEDLPAGTKYKVTETAASNYKTDVSITANEKVETYNSDNQYLVGEKDNSAGFTNTYTVPTPTGIIINNLPFIIMIVLAGAGILFFVISRRRKYDR